MPRRDPRLDVDIRKQRPNRPVFAPHRSPHESSRQPGNHAKQTNTSDFSADFFSSLLKASDDCGLLFFRELTLPHANLLQDLPIAILSVFNGLWKKLARISHPPSPRSRPLEARGHVDEVFCL
jgi:hypothetical protein